MAERSRFAMPLGASGRDRARWGESSKFEVVVTRPAPLS